MKINTQRPSFASWPLSPAMRISLVWEEKWVQMFSLGAEGVSLLLNTLHEQLKAVDYFSNLIDTQQFFKFLEKLIETKPLDSQVLEKINNILSDLFEKIILKKRFNETEAKIPAYYLDLLKLMLEPEHRYLFRKSEININAKNFLTISKIAFHSPELLTQFRHTLLLSFECQEFIKDQVILRRVISNLAKCIEKNNAELNERAVMQLLDVLGVLSSILRSIPGLNQPRVGAAIWRLSRLIYNQFKPFVEKDLLKFIFYKFFLTQSYKNSEHLAQLCGSPIYRRRCISDYVRFRNNHSCQIEQLPNFLIDIHANNRSKLDLDKVCFTLRGIEPFIFWMEDKFSFKLNYNLSQYTLYLADSEKDYLTDKFFFESYDDLVLKDSRAAAYFPSQKSNQTTLLGTTYTHSTQYSVLIHEYIHHLMLLFFNHHALNLALREGIIELNSEGVCSKKNLRSLDIYINEAVIFDFYSPQEFLLHFSALEWVGYLVNEEPQFLSELLQRNVSSHYDARINTYFGDVSNRQIFVTWSQQQTKLCVDYLSHFPDAHQPPLIYLEDIKNFLNQTQRFNSTAHIPKRSLQCYASKENETDIAAYASAETKTSDQMLSQQMKIGIPLPVSALFAGGASACFDDVVLIYQNQYPSLPTYINYGLKPCLFAVMSAGLNTLLFDQTVEIEEKFARLYTYFVINFLSTMAGQILTEKLAERIHNKILCYCVTTFTWILLWNPSLFFSKENELLPTFLLQLIQGFCFKLGEKTYQLGKNICSSSFWHKTRPPTPINEENDLSYRMSGPIEKIIDFRSGT